jgi:(1->4)-alpha-D-glucan 1-alpha-D-glucosylmutase
MHPSEPARLRSRLPASTYRLQLTPEFGFADAADQAGYLAELGVTHAYLSPILQAGPGSQHGYDVVDHSRIAAGLGGEDGLRYLAARLRRNRIGLVVDVVPNHMGVPAPEYLNHQLWSVLSSGQQSPHAHWFDIDWESGGGQLLLPILSGPLRECEAELQLSRLGELPGATAFSYDDDTPVLRYQGHVLPVRSGTETLPLRELLAAQFYRLDSWRAAATELNWRRFFDISSLIAIRVEEPDVFAATHGLLLGLVAEGLIDGLRIDHPDGLADPRGYLRQLATAASGSWIVAEKILAADERLPSDWPCAGTTGYDALAAVGELFTNSDGVRQLGTEYARFTGTAEDFATVARAAKRETASQQLSAEVSRLARLLGRLGDPVLDGVSADELRTILAELLAGFGVYRAYIVPGEAPPAASVRQVRAAAAAAMVQLPARLHPAADQVVALLCVDVDADRRPVRDDLIVRFQQTCAAVQAKGVEDTATYRWTRLVSANEVGADPDHPGRSPAEFHRFARRLADAWPTGMTTLSTHDTKRQEDVRARLAVLAESPEAWAREVTIWHGRASELAGAPRIDPPTEYLMWQTLVGAWPIKADRLTSYLRKAMREAKLSTSWTEPDATYEAAALDIARLALADNEISDRIAAFVAWIAPDAAANSIGAKLVQLTMPGVPDTYQGCELTGLSLVDPDNRRPVDFDRRQLMLAALRPAEQDPASGPARLDGPDDPSGLTDLATTDGLDAAKLLITSCALRLRRDHPDWFTADYQPLTATGAARAHALAFSRGGQAITVVTRLPGQLRRSGGWHDTAIALPPGRWVDVLSGAQYGRAGGTQRDRGMLADLTRRLPVALLAPADERDTGIADAGAADTGAPDPRRPA